MVVLIFEYYGFCIFEEANCRVFFFIKVCIVMLIYFFKNSKLLYRLAQSTKSAVWDGCLKVDRSLELIVIYVEKCSVPDSPFSVFLGGNGPFRWLVGPRLG